jgi:hypothetical protein
MLSLEKVYMTDNVADAMTKSLSDGVVVCLSAHDMKYNKFMLAYNFTCEDIKVRKSFLM